MPPPPSNTPWRRVLRALVVLAAAVLSGTPAAHAAYTPHIRIYTTTVPAATVPARTLLLTHTHTPRRGGYSRTYAQ